MRRPAYSTFWPCLWLGAAFVIIKATHFGLPGSATWAGLAAYGRDLLAATHEDVLFVLGLGLAGQLVLRATARRPRIAQTVFILFVIFCVACVSYAIANLKAIEYFGRPFNYALFRFVKDWGDLRSSIAAQLTPLILLALIGASALYAGLVAITLRRSGRASRLRRFGWRIAGFLAIGLWVGAGWYVFTSTWSEREAGIGIAKNPHWVLLSSFLGGASSGATVHLPHDFPPEDTLEFHPVALRASGPAVSRGDAVARPKNVILIVLESTSAMYLSLYGSPYNTTPNLVAEAANSLVFDNIYSTIGYTFCSFMAIAYSVYPGLPWGYLPLGRPLPGPTLAELLKEHGYRTTFIHSGDLQWEGLYTQIEGHGFDDAWDFRNLECAPLSSWGVEDRCLVDGLIKWIDRDRTRPFFVMGWTDQTHDPYVTSPGVPRIDFFRGSSPPSDATLDRYLNIQHTVDQQLGRLFRALQERGLAEQTLVVITGDHGEAFDFPHRTRGHGATLYQEHVHVPLMLWNPVLFPTGIRSDRIGSHVDINATILDLLGLPASNDWQGRSLFDPTHPPRAYFLTGCKGCYDYLFGVREAGWKYIYNAMTGHELLYDLTRDSTEQRNLAGAEPERSRRLRQRVAAWIAFEQGYIDRLKRKGGER